MHEVTNAQSEILKSVTFAAGSLEAFKAAVMGDTAEAWIAEKRCAKPPVGCGKSLLNEDGSPRFNFDDREERDLAIREWQISGMCPDCWNAMVKACEEEEAELESAADEDRGQYFVPPSEMPALDHECDRGEECTWSVGKYRRDE